jgi:type II secretory pathway pseudopilin PulG
MKRDRQSGFTFLELILVIAISIIVIFTIVLLVNPGEMKARGRDEKKLSDIQNLDRAVNEFKIDNGTYPDLDELGAYIQKIPDNLIYAHNNVSYEIDATLEYYTKYSTDDGGNNPNVYEVGNNLTLL